MKDDQKCSKFCWGRSWIGDCINTRMLEYNLQWRNTELIRIGGSGTSSECVQDVET